MCDAAYGENARFSRAFRPNIATAMARMITDV
jgi:hypothetical protein